MGSIIKASCNCGYEKECLVGSSLMNFFPVCTFPALCRRCSQVVDVNVNSEPPRCLKCFSHDVVIYEGDTLRDKSYESEAIEEWYVEGTNRELKLFSGQHYCPECGENGLIFEKEGSFD